MFEKAVSVIWGCHGGLRDLCEPSEHLSGRRSLAGNGLFSRSQRRMYPAFGACLKGSVPGAAVVASVDRNWHWLMRDDMSRNLKEE